MENPDNLAPINVIPPKKREIKRNLEVIGNKYGLVSAISWYKRKKYPHDEDVGNRVLIKDEIDYNLFNWSTDLASWIARTSISGLIIWFILQGFFVTGPSIRLFFLFGVTWWTLMRFIGDVRHQVRG